MYKHIMIATDGSELASKAVNAGLRLAKALNAKITAVTVTEPWTAYISGEAAIAFPLEDYEKSASESARRTLAAVDDLARSIPIECGSVHVKDQYPADGILEAAKNSRMRSHCDGVPRPARFRTTAPGQCGRQRPNPQLSSRAYLPLSIRLGIAGDRTKNRVTRTTAMRMGPLSIGYFSENRERAAPSCVGFAPCVLLRDSPRRRVRPAPSRADGQTI